MKELADSIFRKQDLDYLASCDFNPVEELRSGSPRFMAQQLVDADACITCYTRRPSAKSC